MNRWSFNNISWFLLFHNILQSTKLYWIPYFSIKNGLTSYYSLSSSNKSIKSNSLESFYDESAVYSKIGIAS